MISTLLSEEPLTDKMMGALEFASGLGALIISAPVYAELMAHPRATPALTDRLINLTRISVDFILDEVIWRDAGEAFAHYAQRRRSSGSGHPKRFLADFIIGAHALHRADRLLTLDPRRYAQSFPKLRLVAS